MDRWTNAASYRERKTYLKRMNTFFMIFMISMIFIRHKENLEVLFVSHGELSFNMVLMNLPAKKAPHRSALWRILALRLLERKFIRIKHSDIVILNMMRNCNFNDTLYDLSNVLANQKIVNT